MWYDKYGNMFPLLIKKAKYICDKFLKNNLNDLETHGRESETFMNESGTFMTNQ